jgi:predicted MFS family arabinose efflux permease
VWGTAIGRFAIPLIAVTTLAATPSEVGLLAAAATAPFLLLALPAGAWLDRMSRRPVMVAADVARCLLFVAIAALDAVGLLSIPSLLVIISLVGACTVFFDLAAQSHLPDLVDAGDLTLANARLATLMQTTVVAGPAVAGWLTGAYEPSRVVLLTAAGYLWSALWLLRTRRVPPPPRPDGPRSLRREIGEGVRFVATEARLRAVALAGALVNVGSVGTTAMLPVLGLRELGWSARDLGLFLAVGGVGGLLGAMTSRRVAERFGLGRSMVVISLAIVPASVALPLVGTVIPAWAAATAWGAVIFKVGFDGVVAMTLRQSVTPASLLGRVNGVMRLVFSGAITFGGVLAATVAGVGGPRAAMWASCGLLALVWVPLAQSPLRADDAGHP